MTIADEQQRRTVPDLVGLKLSEARQRAVERGVRVVVGEVGSLRPKGTVVGQDLDPGTIVPPEALLRLLISRGRTAGSRGIALPLLYAVVFVLLIGFIVGLGFALDSEGARLWP